MAATTARPGKRMTNDPQEDSRIADLLKCERRRNAALISADLAALDVLFTADLVHIHSTGVQQNRVELLDYVQNAIEYISIERRNLSIRFYGSAAIMTGEMFNTLRLAGKTDVIHAESLVTQVWVQHGDSWRQASFQATRRAPPA
jgi:hypothetical protein